MSPLQVQPEPETVTVAPPRTLLGATTTASAAWAGVATARPAPAASVATVIRPMWRCAHGSTCLCSIHPSATEGSIGRGSRRSGGPAATSLFLTELYHAAPIESARKPRSVPDFTRMGCTSGGRSTPVGIESGAPSDGIGSSDVRWTPMADDADTDKRRIAFIVLVATLLGLLPRRRRRRTSSGTSQWHLPSVLHEDRRTDPWRHRGRRHLGAGADGVRRSWCRATSSISSSA